MNPRLRPAQPRVPDGLVGGEAVKPSELAEIPFFEGKKRPFKMKLAKNLGASPGSDEASLRAVARRRYSPGDVICNAGDFGSSAFLLVEGTARSYVPERAEAAAIPGRKRASFGFLTGLFGRRTSARRRREPDALAVGEVTRYAAMPAARPREQQLAPGQYFGIDSCINFYPRETTVEAVTECTVIEMLRSVLDTVRDGGSLGAEIDAAYRESAIRSALRLAPIFEGAADAQLDAIAGECELVTPDSDDVKDGLLYEEGADATGVYVIRAGSIQFTRKRSGRDAVLGYLGRGAVFGLEVLTPAEREGPPRLVSLSHPEHFSPIELVEDVTLGRSSACEVVFPADDRTIGRRQCKIERREDDLYLLDLGSANPTTLNGAEAAEARVRVGDRIQVQGYVFELQRGIAQTTQTLPRRIATASGLDSFEVVRVPTTAVNRVMVQSDRTMGSAVSILRNLSAAAREGAPVDDALVEPFVELNLYNSQNTLLIDLDRCTRCDECVKACSDAHDGVARFTRDGPRVGKYMVTLACRSCTDPKCMVGCPVGSIRRLDSLQIEIEDWCIGCERCANQCPFGNINMVEVAAEAKAEEEAAPSFKATVCDLCAGYESPNCVYACPHDAAIRVNPQEFLTSSDRR